MLHKSNWLSLSSGGTSFNALLLSNRWEYDSKLPKTRFVGLAYGPNFNHCDVADPKATEFGKLTQNNCHYAVQGH